MDFAPAGSDAGVCHTRRAPPSDSSTAKVHLCTLPGPLPYTEGTKLQTPAFRKHYAAPGRAERLQQPIEPNGHCPTAQHWPPSHAEATTNIHMDDKLPKDARGKG